MKSRTIFALGIAFGYLIYRERYDIRDYKKRIEELEKENKDLKISFLDQQINYITNDIIQKNDVQRFIDSLGTKNPNL